MDKLLSLSCAVLCAALSGLYFADYLEQCEQDRKKQERAERVSRFYVVRTLGNSEDD